MLPYPRLGLVRVALQIVPRRTSWTKRAELLCRVHIQVVLVAHCVLELVLVLPELGDPERFSSCLLPIFEEK